MAALADEMETPGPGRIKAMITLAGNPALSLPNGPRLERAFAQLDYMVSGDYYLNDTTRHADLILPPVTGLETDHYPILELGLAIRNHARYAPAIFPKPPAAKYLWEIMTDLVCSYERHLGGFSSVLGRVKRTALYFFHPQRQLNALLKYGPRKLSLTELKKHPHGLDLGPMTRGLEAVIAKGGRVRLTPPELVADVERLQAKLDAPRPDPEELLLVSRRTLRSINSWMHNSRRLVKGRDQCTLRMHPADAERRGVVAGGTAIVSSRIGELRVPVELSDEMMPGVVSMTFGWGHDRPGIRMAVAGQRPGVSMNDIVDESLYDKVSGISVLDGIPVRVGPAPR